MPVNAVKEQIMAQLLLIFIDFSQIPMSENGRWWAHVIISDDDGDVFDVFILILCVPLASINSIWF